MTRFKITAAASAILIAASGISASTPTPPNHQSDTEDNTAADSISAESQEATEIIRLTEDDYIEVAQRLDVETAAIKAVVDIEAGPTHQGFFAPGLPLVNFDLTMFRQQARRKGINLSHYNKSHAVVFSRPNVRRYGSTQAGQQARLKAARNIDESTAIQGTFWGMFQIGGFNWKLCGCTDIHDFVERMSRSEREQLELFANFIQNIGLDKYLRQKNWAAFARRYNGASYASRGYHTRMAAAYNRHKRQEQAAASDRDDQSTPTTQHNH